MQNQLNGVKAKKKAFLTATALTVLAALLLAVLATAFAYAIPYTYDMTAARVFTLSEASKTVLAELTSPVRIGAVYAQGNADAMVSALLAQYEGTSELVTVEYLDAQKDPAVLAGYDLGEVRSVGNGSIIINGNGRSRIINDSDLFASGAMGNVFYGERELTGALRYVSADSQAKAYFTTGHGENTLAQMSEAINMLALDAYAVEQLVLLQQKEIPVDADVLIMASPEQDVTEGEAAMLRSYLTRGGRLLLLLDPMLGTDAAALTNLSAITQSYGVDIRNNYVFEADSSYYLLNSNLYLIPRYGAHDITTQLGVEEKSVVLPVARGLGAFELTDETVTRDGLLYSSAKSWARVDMSLQESGVAASDIQGPIALGFASVKSVDDAGGKASRVVVLGDSSFAVSDNLGAQANADLFINCVNWLAGGRESAIIAGKAINSDTLMVRGSDFLRLAVICCGVMPLIMFAGALAIWFGRRNK